jgi:hypothetical protein
MHDEGAAEGFDLNRESHTHTHTHSHPKLREAAAFALDKLQALRAGNAPTAAQREEIRRISDQMLRNYNCELIAHGMTFTIRAHNSGDIFDLVKDFFHQRY